MRRRRSINEAEWEGYRRLVLGYLTESSESHKRAEQSKNEVELVRELRLIQDQYQRVSREQPLVGVEAIHAHVVAGFGYLAQAAEAGEKALANGTLNGDFRDRIAEPLQAEAWKELAPLYKTLWPEMAAEYDRAMSSSAGERFGVPPEDLEKLIPGGQLPEAYADMAITEGHERPDGNGVASRARIQASSSEENLDAAPDGAPTPEADESEVPPSPNRQQLIHFAANHMTRAVGWLLLVSIYGTVQTIRFGFSRSDYGLLLVAPAIFIVLLVIRGYAAFNPPLRWWAVMATTISDSV